MACIQLKDRDLDFILLAITAAGAVPSPRTSSTVQIMFSFWSFEISESSEKSENHYRFRFLF